MIWFSVTELFVYFIYCIDLMYIRVVINSLNFIIILQPIFNFLNHLLLVYRIFFFIDLIKSTNSNTTF